MFTGLVQWSMFSGSCVTLRGELRVRGIARMYSDRRTDARIELDRAN